MAPCVHAEVVVFRGLESVQNQGRQITDTVDDTIMIYTSFNVLSNPSCFTRIYSVCMSLTLSS